MMIAHRIEFAWGRLSRPARPCRVITAGLVLAAGLSAPARATTFTKIIDPANPVVNDQAESGGAAWIDLNDDGYLDLFVANGNLSTQNNALYRNTGTGFVKVLSGPVVNDGGSSIGGTFGDYDNDGHPDLFVTNRNNYGNFLYHGEGDTVFTKVTTGRPVTDIGNSNSSSWTDIDDDGHLDLYVVNFSGADFLYRNDGAPAFTFTAVDTAAPQGGTFPTIPGAWGDIDNDGRDDLFIGIAGGFNDQIWRNLGGVRFVLNGLSDNRSTLGASWGDFDNDGYLDLITTIYGGAPSVLYRNSGPPSFTLTPVDTSVFPAVVANSVGSAWGDYDNDGDLDLCISNDGQNEMLFENSGPPGYRLTRVLSGAPVTDVANSFGCVWGDYDRDGDLDLFIANRLNQKNFLYRNEGSTNHWLEVRLIGRTSNASGIGARVRVKATIGGASRWQLREVEGQTGYNCQNLEQHFGLGDAAMLDSLVVDWPSGHEDRFANVGADRLLRIVEAGGFTEVAMSGSGGPRPAGTGAASPRSRGIDAVQLGQSSPVSIRLRLAQPASIEMEIVDARGRLIGTERVAAVPAGEAVVPVASLANAPSGVYLCRLTAGARRKTLHLVVVH